MKKSKASLSVIFITVFIDLLGFGILIPILPTFASKDLAVSDFGIGLIIAVFSFVQFLFNPILGKISDKVGRKPIIVLSLLITSSSYILFSFSNTFILLLISRMLAGLGGSNIGVAQAYIADVTTKEERSKGMGLIGAAFGLGFVFGPLIGGLISGFGYEYAGYGSAAFSFMAFLFAIFFLPESNTIRQKDSKISFKLFDISEIRSTFKIPQVGLLIMIFFIIIFSIANIYGTFAILGYKVYGFSDRENGYLFGVMGIVGTIIQGGLIKKLTKRFSDISLVRVGTIFMMLGLGFLPYGDSFLSAVLIVIVLSVGTGLLQPMILSMISKYSPDNKQGAILGITQSFSALGRVLGPLWGGFAFDYIGYEFPFLTGALFTFITFMITIIVLNKKYMKAY
ncbi:MAG: tetracycline resistance MFS efflux pump [Ignavibacteriae bacterium HGW-Ignavibacteriae-2]|nr:MAG: tetracycline resistance MFS efflux pump [Ignavibacteriae bacterium HGW-Ignavibacteriae-2]